MSRSDNRAALTDEIARFQAEVRRLALATVRAVIAAELDRRQLQRKSEPARKTDGARKQKAGRAARGASTSPQAPAPSEPAASDGATEAADAATTGGKRAPWTRDSVIKELAAWIVSGTAIDAPFVTRHGPPGLVAATRRIFGRFDAALNVASLHIAKLYPEGPPNQRPGTGRPARVAMPRARKASATTSAAPAEPSAAPAQSAATDAAATDASSASA